MAGFIPEQKIADIQHAADLVEVVGETVLLKNAGRNFVGLCPFHSEKAPSFTVSPDKQIFYCFGCKAGGNVFRFVMMQDGLSFPEAARALGRRYGIDIPVQSKRAGSHVQPSERKEMSRINQSALDFFRRQLAQHPDGKRARAYLEERGISKEIIDRFSLGYAPREWEALHRYFSRTGVSLQMASKCGLIIARKNRPGSYDRFRDRIIFPIFHLNGEVVGFGGRVLDDALPKYLNSPDSILFNKSRSLYGLQQSKEACRKIGSVIIVEGNIDVLTLHQHGIENTAATLGTALTNDHIRRLKGFATRFFLVYDSDDSGMKAAERIAASLIEAHVDVHVVVLPPGHDPDSYLTEFGADSFLKVISKSLKIMPFLTECAVKKYGLSTEGRIRIAEDLKSTLSSIGDRMSRSLYVKQVAERIGVDESELLEKVRHATAKRPDGEWTRHRCNPAESSVKSKPRRLSYRLERQVITIMLQCPELIPVINSQKIIGQFADQNLKTIARAVASSTKNGIPLQIRDVIMVLNEPEKEQIVAGLAMVEEKWHREAALKLIAHFKNIRCREQNLKLNQEIRAAEARGDQATVNELLRQKQIQARSQA